MGIEQTRPKVNRVYDESDPPTQRLLRYAGMDPEHGLLRWANFDWTLLLPSEVFEADDAGRSYRFRPLTHSVWLRNLPITAWRPVVLPGAGRARAGRRHPGNDGRPPGDIAADHQLLGPAGPEPDPDAPLRGIVLGDSFMQGMFIGDDETPPECLRRYLRDRLKTRVSILNTGVLGYSPEQYYYSLIAFADRFRPHFVVVSVFSNDFGNVVDVAGPGRGRLARGEVLAGEDRPLLPRHATGPTWSSPPRTEPNMFGKRKSGYYPGVLANTLAVDSLMFLDPMDDFINGHLRELRSEWDRAARPRGPRPVQRRHRGRSLLGGRLRGLGRLRGPPARPAAGGGPSSTARAGRHPGWRQAEGTRENWLFSLSGMRRFARRPRSDPRMTVAARMADRSGFGVRTGLRRRPVPERIAGPV